MSFANIVSKIFNPDTAFGNIMCRFLTLIITLAAAACLYFATVSVFSSSLINIALFITACFLILQAASNIDRTHGFGAFSGSTESNSEQEPPRPDEHHDHHHKPHYKQASDENTEQD